jgi:hypothetical protein
VEGRATHGYAVNGYVLIEESRKSFLVSVVVELTGIDAIGDHQHDLSAATTN